ncbi:Uncharacterised protein [Bordetella ansorpii]|uniref:DUF4148 domain-containing protein n=1 Tax=Bordetella ansorpii TaxID=288768 RepID=A0A157SHM9_9BORD|nr:DUF4148 domain-containing protein [Bordetella ansorpii]SAI69909.1 Uncharacterised protein [Bordetella ansorpii]
MKTIASTLILAASLIGASAHAADNVEPNDTPFQGVYGQQDQAGKTRAQVQAELADARAQGLLTFGEADQPAYTGVDTTPNRAQVEAAPLRARDDRAEAWYPDGA